MCPGGLWTAGAQAVLALHAAWIAAVILLPFWAMRRPWLRLVHLAMMATVLTIMSLGAACPLTHLENWLLSRASSDGVYGGGCIGHYLQRMIYVDVPPAAIGACLTVWLLLWTVVYLAPRRHRPD